MGTKRTPRKAKPKPTHLRNLERGRSATGRPINQFGVSVPEFTDACRTAFNNVLTKIAGGASLYKSVQEQEGTPFCVDTFYVWIRYSEEPNCAKEYIGLADKYMRACTLRRSADEERLRAYGELAAASTYLDEGGNKRVDAGAVNAARLAADNVKWIMARREPDKWGGKVAGESDQKIIIENAPESPGGEDG